MRWIIFHIQHEQTWGPDKHLLWRYPDDNTINHTRTINWPSKAIRKDKEVNKLPHFLRSDQVTYLSVTINMLSSCLLAGQYIVKTWISRQLSVLWHFKICLLQEAMVGYTFMSFRLRKTPHAHSPSWCQLHFDDNVVDWGPCLSSSKPRVSFLRCDL